MAMRPEKIDVVSSPMRAGAPELIRLTMDGQPFYLAAGSVVGLESAADSATSVLFSYGNYNTSRLVDESPEEVARLLGWTPPAADPAPAVDHTPTLKFQGGRPCSPSPAVDGYGQDETGADYAEANLAEHLTRIAQLADRSNKLARGVDRLLEVSLKDNVCRRDTLERRLIEARHDLMGLKLDIDSIGYRTVAARKLMLEGQADA